MARRRIGQERLSVGGLEPRGGRSLDELAGLVNWAELDVLLAGISASAKANRLAATGTVSGPPLATSHDLSDVRLADALDDRASFRRFCGFAAVEPALSARHSSASAPSWCAVSWTGRCSRPSPATRCPRVDRPHGTLVDATLIPSASIRMARRRARPGTAARARARSQGTHRDGSGRWASSAACEVSRGQPPRSGSVGRRPAWRAWCTEVDPLPWSPSGFHMEAFSHGQDAPALFT